jgi:uncharacterized protein
MAKIIVVIIVLSLLFLWIKSSRKIPKTNDKQNKKTNESQALKSDMIKCNKCETYIQINDAIMSDGNYICSNNCE